MISLYRGIDKLIDRCRVMAMKSVMKVWRVVTGPATRLGVYRDRKVSDLIRMHACIDLSVLLIAVE